MNFRVPQIALGSALILGLAWMTSAAQAAAGAVDEAVVKQLKAGLESPENGLLIESVEDSEIAGLYAVQFVNGPLVYSNKAGNHFVVGDMFKVENGGFTNLAELRRDGERKDKIDAVADEDMIVFAPAAETRASITIFTDVTCFYCQKLHKEVPELNKRGVEVRYLAYPRAGVGSDGFRQLASAWCSDNPQDTLTRMKNKESVADNVCSNNPVADQYQLGQEMGVRGTPAIITDSGKMIPGYQSADELMVTLGLN
jgi:thiol:disulfide interchange protein DsbC